MDGTSDRSRQFINETTQPWLLLLLLPWRRQRRRNDTVCAYIGQRPSDIDARSNAPPRQCVKESRVRGFLEPRTAPGTCVALTRFTFRRHSLVRLPLHLGPHMTSIDSCPILSSCGSVDWFFRLYFSARTTSFVFTVGIYFPCT